MPNKKKPTSGGGGVPTNYGYATLADGTQITFLLQADGTGIVQTPLSLKGKTVKKTSTGWVLI